MSCSRVSSRHTFRSYMMNTACPGFHLLFSLSHAHSAFQFRSSHRVLLTLCVGPIVRITPTELHVNDPEFFDILYARDGQRHKYAYFSGRFGYASDTFSTWQHELHHQRRKALSPFFSAKSIREFQPVIRAKADKPCTKLSAYVDDGRVLHLN